jgi:hypothetical protein
MKNTTHPDPKSSVVQSGQQADLICFDDLLRWARALMKIESDEGRLDKGSDMPNAVRIEIMVAMHIAVPETQMFMFEADHVLGPGATHGQQLPPGRKPVCHGIRYQGRTLFGADEFGQNEIHDFLMRSRHPSIANSRSLNGDLLFGLGPVQEREQLDVITEAEATSKIGLMIGALQQWRSAQLQNQTLEASTPMAGQRAGPRRV